MRENHKLSIFFLIFTIILCSFGSAIEITSDTETKLIHGDITHIFTSGLGILDAELSNTGIILDDNKLSTLIQGGTLEIKYISWDDPYELILESSVPQTIVYKYNINGSRYYFQDSDGIHIDNYKISTESTNITLIRASKEEVIVPVVEEDRPSWLKRNTFFMFIGDDIVYVTNKTSLIFCSILLFVSLLIFIRSRRVIG